MTRHKNRFLLFIGFLIVFGFIALAQEPPPELEGEELRTWLRDNLYTGLHQELGYTQARIYMYNYIDNHTNTITCVYGGYEHYWEYGGTGSNPAPINCEHTVPQSFFDSNEPMKSDIHHLFPTYDQWNSRRGNYPFDEIYDSDTQYWMIDTTESYVIPSSNIDEYSEATISRFEPREDHKGNAVRAIFYFYTMYPAYDINQVGDLNLLLFWHVQDPVDADEIARNDDVEFYQGNRNPYIDHPEYAQRAWGSGSGDLFPLIFNMSAAPAVPLDTETRTVIAYVTDDGVVTGVDLNYDADGAPQTPVAMTPTGNPDEYSGTISAQADGTLVEYFISATDDAAQTSDSPVYGVYWGLTDIAAIHAGVDADGILTNAGYWARIQGALTVEPDIFSDTNTELYIQDATGGVNLFKYGQNGIAGDRYDEVVVTGKISQYNGLTELALGEPGASFTNMGPAAAVPPTVITLSELDESVEGLLVTVENLQLVSGSIPPFGSDSLEVSDGSKAVGVIRIDGDTDIPGADDPSGTFSVTGVVSQYDTDIPYLDGYQIKPREKTDFDPPLTGDTPPADSFLINEFLADPPPDISGDANGDGVRDGSQDEFVELVNNSGDYVCIGGWTLSDGYGVRHVFPLGTLVPPGQAVVVFGGGTPTGDFGLCADLELVFTASTGMLGLSHGLDGDTITLTDPSGTIVDDVSYGAEGGNDESLNLDPDVTGTGFNYHSNIIGSGGAVFSPGTRVDGTVFADCPTLIITEVLYDTSGSDDGLEWVELYNNSPDAIDLGGYSLGNGGTDYTYSQAQLAGIVQPFTTFVVGGPTSSSTNADPAFDQAFNFDPDFQNSGTAADGVALFDLPAAGVNGSTVPIDAVIYGPVNSNNLMDQTGTAPAPHVGDASSGSSIERTAVWAEWRIQFGPDPNNFSSSGWTFSKGDCDFDETLTVLDLVALMNMLAGNLPVTGYSRYVSDMDGGGSQDAADAIMLANTLADNM